VIARIIPLFSLTLLLFVVLSSSLMDFEVSCAEILFAGFSLLKIWSVVALKQLHGQLFA